MAAFSVTLRPYRSARFPWLKYVIRIRRPDGTVKRSFYRTLKEAEAEKSVKLGEIQDTGVRALSLDNRARLQALDAIEKLAPFEATIAEAVAFFIEHRRSGASTVQEACDNYIASRKKKVRSERHMNTLRQFLTRFTAGLGKTRLSILAPEDIEQWLHDLGVSPVSVNSYRRLLNAVFQYAVDRKMAKENPVAAIEKLKEARGKVGILTPAQMAKLLTAAQGERDLLTTVAIGGFAGLRPEEVARLKWSAIDLDHGQIDCGSELTKTAKQRYVKIEPVLSEWLRPLMCIFSSSNEAAKMNIHEENFRRRWDAMRKSAGFAIAGSGAALTDGEKAALIPWPHDALRHSFASYHLAKFELIDVLALQMGHENTKMIFKNYRERVKAADAEAWWKLLPEAKP
jgi:integrase